MGTAMGITPHHKGVDDVLHCIIRILKTLLRLLQPAPPTYQVPPSPARVTSEPVLERGLWLAMYGIDIRPCPTCGATVTA
ncbi:hypothetical protein ACWEF9_25730 [Streptomyces sp. NPDC004980]